MADAKSAMKKLEEAEMCGDTVLGGCCALSSRRPGKEMLEIILATGKAKDHAAVPSTHSLWRAVVYLAAQLSAAKDARLTDLLMKAGNVRGSR